MPILLLSISFVPSSGLIYLIVICVNKRAKKTSETTYMTASQGKISQHLSRLPYLWIGENTFEALLYLSQVNPRLVENCLYPPRAQDSDNFGSLYHLRNEISSWNFYIFKRVILRKPFFIPLEFPSGWINLNDTKLELCKDCLLYTSPSPRD